MSSNKSDPNYNAKLDPSSPEFDLNAVPPPPVGGLPIDKLIVEPATFTGGFPGIMGGAEKEKKVEEKKGDGEKKEGEK